MRTLFILLQEGGELEEIAPKEQIKEKKKRFKESKSRTVLNKAPLQQMQV